METELTTQASTLSGQDRKEDRMKLDEQSNPELAKRKREPTLDALAKDENRTKLEGREDPELANGTSALVEDGNRTKLDEQENPLNWSPLPRCKVASFATDWDKTKTLTCSLGVGIYTSTVVGIAGIVGFSSSVHTPAIAAIAEDFRTTRLLSTLGATTYLVGSAFGPLLFAPLSELWSVNR